MLYNAAIISLIGQPKNISANDKFLIFILVTCLFLEEYDIFS